jgi:hypothetical protein
MDPEICEEGNEPESQRRKNNSWSPEQNDPQGFAAKPTGSEEKTKK